MIILLILIVLLFVIYRTLKKDPDRLNSIPVVPQQKYLTLQISDQNKEYNDNFAERNKEYLDENDDYHMSKKELLEEHSDEYVFKFLPTHFSCSVKGNKVYDEDGHYIGYVNMNIGSDWQTELILEGGDWKYPEDDEIEKGTKHYFFKLEIKKPQ